LAPEVTACAVAEEGMVSEASCLSAWLGVSDSGLGLRA
jgi:hypothetical protein